MLRKPSKVVFAVLLVLVFSTAASALPSQDALSARPAQSVYTVVHIDDLNGLLQNIFSPANIEMATSLVPPDQAQAVMMFAAFASQVPAKSVLVAVGMTPDKGPFVQVAATMPESALGKLKRVSDGNATGVEIISLLLGDAGMMFAEGFAPEVQKGPKGPYYTLGPAAFAAKDNLLLIASSPAELEASLGALEKKDNRLSFKRRFDSPNYWLTHMDMATSVALAAQAGGIDGKPDSFVKLFKAPLEVELGFTPKPGSFLVSCAANVLESMADSAHYKEMKPVKGANLLLAGGGKLLFALSSQMVFKAADFKANPEFVEAWGQFIEALGTMDISEQNVEDLLNGSFSIALGSDATVMGAAIPGGYIALTGRQGAAAKILGKLTANPNVPLVPSKANGWDSLFVADPAAMPIPLVFGVAKDTLFAGVVNSESLAKTPALPAEFAKMLNDPLFGAGVIDTAGIWNWLRQEVANPNSLLAANLEDGVKGILENILEADLSIPLVKIWQPELEKSFLEFSIVDVPQGKRLLPRLLKMGQIFISQ